MLVIHANAQTDQPGLTSRDMEERPSTTSLMAKPRAASRPSRTSRQVRAEAGRRGISPSRQAVSAASQ